MHETINAAQCADLLQCTEATVEELTRKGDLPGVKIGRGWIYIKADLLNYLAEKARSEAKDRKDAAIASQVAHTKAPIFKHRRKTPPALPSVPPTAGLPSPRP